MSRMYYTKGNFSTKGADSSFDNFKFFLCEDSREIYKFTDLAKLLLLMQIDVFPIPFKVLHKLLRYT